LEQRFGFVSDVKMISRLLGYRRKLNDALKMNKTVPDLWYETLERVGSSKPAIVFCEDEGTTRTFTFGELEAYSNQVGNMLVSQGLNPGDTVALFMENRPEFIGTWLGASKMGLAIAMINTSIVKKGLAHCINVSNSKAVIYGKELEEPLGECVNDLSGIAKLLCQGGKPALPNALDVDSEIKKIPGTIANKGKDRRSHSGFTKPWGYIYTSGTTGLPKAAVVNHNRFTGYGAGMAVMCNLSQDDIVYTCLPLFHSAGGGIGAGMMVIGGRTLVIRKKFSAKNFFVDCAKHNVTAVQYIGELCRYLLASPPNDLVDRAHKVRIAIGNGLRPEIWEEFQKRFNIPEIGEFYGSTEGTGALLNHCTSKEAVGFVGRLGALANKVLGVKIVKYDVENDRLVRGPDGLCVECGPSEAGELLMPIKADDPGTAFAGYSDTKATEKKLVRDAFVKGDLYFSTGDLLSRDAKGYFKFVDRIGDTFRWKGENCSTTEVTEVVSTFPGIEEANVYGVLVPNNQDGRAPCAAITPKDGNLSNLDLDAFRKYVSSNLPPYAVPLFLRIIPQIAVTATMKHQKGDLRNEGIDIAKVKDKLFYLHSEKGYIPLTPQVYAQVTTPGARL